MSAGVGPAAEQVDKPEEAKSDVDVAPLLAHAPQVMEEDDGAVHIADNEADDEAALEAPYSAEALLDTANVLTGGEEAPPRLKRDYATAFFNTDPRIAFDALHIGALRAIEVCERMSRSSYDYPPWYVPEAELVIPPSSSERPFFFISAMHPVVQSRAPIEREDRRVDELLSHPSRQALAATIGPDMLEKLRLHRHTEVRRRQRREVPGPPTTRVAPSTSSVQESSGEP
ncbi:hypothetical protein ABB37_08226 [Leptomonas pyrrhocoris]|uniref:Uncharacterized protein n=1 Tax=Leptomonas pyrrhocoris TaxID=157538 RepID=A0A0M9FTJ7_LEPPY|nr:hypothetical protein ABB37_08226 [Leptomonas pyrrhocoris]KPA75659.1 hypothetical protein ABB37_08226 [Leptomonas pyrrhocoris]|eukprot:XP_015654098.1 hypothetical protein ABB37_08226 [Leptomonas pyrrhocoris]